MRKRPELKMQEREGSSSAAIQIPGNNSSFSSAMPSRYSAMSTSAPVTNNFFGTGSNSNFLDMQQQRHKYILPASSSRTQHGIPPQIAPNTINPTALVQQDLFIADAFPLQVDTEMTDIQQHFKSNQNNESINNPASPFEDYLADDPLESVLSASLPDDSPQHSSPVTFASVPKTMPQKKASGTSSAAISITSPMTSQDHLEGSSFGSNMPSRSLGSTSMQRPEDEFEKQRKRRESHNAVERRRRDNINERIQELASLVPDCNSDKPHKGIILKKTTDYVKYLQRVNNDLVERIKELEIEVDNARLNGKGS